MRLIRLAVAQAAAVTRGRLGREVMQPAGELEARVEAVALARAMEAAAAVAMAAAGMVAAAEVAAEEVEVAAPTLPWLLRLLPLLRQRPPEGQSPP